MIAHSFVSGKVFKSTRGLSIVEVMIIVSVLGIIGAVGTGVFSDFRKSANQVQVDSGLSNLNSAVAAYLSNGGVIPDNANINDVIAKLKTVRKDPEDVVGFNGSFIDRRLGVERSDDFEVGIQWNPIKVRFEKDTSDNRFKIVVLEEESPIVEEDRLAATLSWGDNWIWEFNEVEENNNYRQPSEFTINPEPFIPPVSFQGPQIQIRAVENEVITVSVNSANNAGFENENGGFNDRVTTFGRPNEGPVAFNVAQENVDGWRTTASDGLIEIWQSGFSGVEAFEGDFFAEFNATQVSTLFQAVDITGADFVNIFFAHGQRARSSEQLSLLVGVNPPATRTRAEVSSGVREDLLGQGFTEVLNTNTNSVGGFTVYRDRLDISTLNLPEGTDTLYFAFQSIGAFAGDSTGNFLDDVRFEGASEGRVGGFEFDIGSGNSNSNVLQSARITLLDAEFEDNIEVNNLPEGFDFERITTGADIEITITGEAFRDEYASILEGIEFSTTSAETRERRITIEVNDGFSISSPVEYVVEFN